MEANARNGKPRWAQQGAWALGTPEWVLLREPRGPAHLQEEAEGQGSDAVNHTDTIAFALVA